jgi:hypothetical protein
MIPPDPTPPPAAPLRRTATKISSPRKQVNISSNSFGVEEEEEVEEQGADEVGNGILHRPSSPSALDLLDLSSSLLQHYFPPSPRQPPTDAYFDDLWGLAMHQARSRSSSPPSPPPPPPLSPPPVRDPKTGVHLIPDPNEDPYAGSSSRIHLQSRHGHASSPPSPPHLSSASLLPTALKEALRERDLARQAADSATHRLASIQAASTRRSLSPTLVDTSSSPAPVRGIGSYHRARGFGGGSARGSSTHAAGEGALRQAYDERGRELSRVEARLSEVFMSTFASHPIP